MKIKARWSMGYSISHRVAMCGVWDGDCLIGTLYVFATWEQGEHVFLGRLKEGAQTINEVLADIEALKKWTQPHMPTNGSE